MSFRSSPRDRDRFIASLQVIARVSLYVVGGFLVTLRSKYQPTCRKRWCWPRTGGRMNLREVITSAYMDHKNLANEAIDARTHHGRRIVPDCIAAKRGTSRTRWPCSLLSPRRRATSAKSWLRLMPARTIGGEPSAGRRRRPKAGTAMRNAELAGVAGAAPDAAAEHIPFHRRGQLQKHKIPAKVLPVV